MKGVLLLCGLFVASAAYAAAPSDALIYSCMSASSVSPLVHVKPIPTNESIDEDDYKPGYKATFFQYKGKDIGYARSAASNALIYDGILYQTSAATRLLGGNVKPVEVNPNLAMWLLANEGKDQFLCVSDTLDGLGRSGSYQNVRYAYLLSLSSPRRLYFALDDIRHYKKH
ncbi:hypothetical protein E1N52_22040 [Paraburkholderia guartelaensis]|uniref:DUF3455 domain-containing protein n=1 Tax=Paraburkholderia guartelaensis TaxID=2546446 RepID=A0A4R5LBY1_9BURK|nr:hypothetical protein [Paraburkholderia guartelaensis]TDG06241.1 hypothetical protein E1N52_22040 [Paraburkholderia guartelaensis]